jgi:membrane protease YdiL (CAAX protease family)
LTEPVATPAELIAGADERAPATHPVPRLQRCGELLLLYVAAPGAIALASIGHRWIVLPSILAGSAVSCALLWFDESYDRRRLFDLSRRRLGPLLLRTALILLALLVLLWAAGQVPSFRMPRERPLVWLGVLVLYPLLSALPQEVMYRVLFFHRYGDLFQTSAARIAASALLFGWAHVLVHNHIAMLLATAGGILLSITWHRSRSLLLVSVEHSLYGAFIFTAGVGGMFVNGVRLVSSVLK